MFSDSLIAYTVFRHPMPRDSSSTVTKASFNTRVLRLRLKDKHAAVLRDRAMWANQVWNYYNDLQQQVWYREKRFLSGYDFAAYTKEAGKEDQTKLALFVRYAPLIRLDSFQSLRTAIPERPTLDVRY